MFYFHELNLPWIALQAPWTEQESLSVKCTHLLWSNFCSGNPKRTKLPCFICLPVSTDRAKLLIAVHIARSFDTTTGIFSWIIYRPFISYGRTNISYLLPYRMHWSTKESLHSTEFDQKDHSSSWPRSIPRRYDKAQ